MNSIQIVLPIEVLSGAKSLTPEGISEYLADATRSAERVEAAERNEKALAQKLVDWGDALETVLNIDNEWNKINALRSLATEAKQYTNFVKGKI